tara:strand:+ start:3731 stop:5047 length:1317 start_codon:yes stop_codon:yes gene_type:complete
MSGSGLPPLFKTAPKTGVPTGNIGMTMPTTSRLDQALLQKGSYGDAGKLSQMFSPEQLKMIPRLPTAGLLNNQSSSYFTPPKMPQAPKTGLLDNFGSNLMNNNLFMLGAALSDRSKPFAQNFANFQNNMLQRQLLGRQLQQQDFTNRLALADLGIKQATSGMGTLSTKSFVNKEGKEIILNYDTKRGLLDSQGQVISPDTLVKQGYSEVNPDKITIRTGDTAEAIKAELFLEQAKGEIKSRQAFADKSNDLGLKRIEETVHGPALKLVDFAKNVGFINQFINESKLDKEEGGKVFKFKTNMLGMMGLSGKNNAVSVDEVVEALRVQYAPKLREAGSGATSDYEMTMYLAAFPSLAMTAEGRAMLERAAQTIGKRESEYSTLVHKYMGRTGKIPSTNELGQFQEEARNKYQLDIDIKKKIGIYNEDEEMFKNEFGVAEL